MLHVHARGRNRCAGEECCSDDREPIGALNRSSIKFASPLGAQVLLRWALDQGVAVIPGATSAAHISENLQVPLFDLTATDRRRLADARPAAFKRWRNLSEER